MLFRIIRGGDFSTILIYLASIAFLTFCSSPVHEYAHALAAYKLGDNTAKHQGRLTLNPFAHISLIGTAMMLLFGFGYAKPVPVNIRNLKNPKRDFALVGIAGPISNIIMATVFFFFLNIVFAFFYSNPLGSVLFNFFLFISQINVYLAVFNLIPIPPLDGSRILTAILPDKYYYKLLYYEKYMMIALFALLYLGILEIPLGFISNYIMRGVLFITGLPFGVNLSQYII